MSKAGQSSGPPTRALDLGDEAIHWDFSAEMSYGQYLCLDRLLDCQKPLSAQHDEMLFITIHQASELWMKLVVFELSAALRCVREDRLGPAFKMLARVAAIQRQLIQSWSVLATLTPTDYSSFRDTLGHSSGFQSYQYRLIEFLLGNKNRRLIEVHRNDPAVHARLQQALERPSLYDETLQLLHRRGLQMPSAKLERDWGEPYEPDERVEAAWQSVYHNVEDHWDLYELAEKLVDLEHALQRWRFEHMKTVERIIGFKRGTGGSSGVGYLKKVLDLRFFPELWTVRTLL
ncbi:MAG: tryptophan 2,3-dioxygenase [Nitrococcus mobilis]|nr:tryptophan 2,3-dioxygenase [Nitrococcus mobilis]